MARLPRYSHHRHTGRLLPHRETSYGFLLGVIVAVGALLLGVSWDATEASTTASGSYAVFAVVPAPKVTVAPVITSPSNGQSFSTNPITVTGTCPDNTLVKVFKNDILAGSTICQQNRTFSLQIDLVVGANKLTAAAFNVNDETGPVSNAVNVTLNVPPGGLGFSTELIIQTPTYYRGTAPGVEIVWPLELVGGQAPYAVNFDWGDGHSDLVTRTAPGPFTLQHTYTKTGGYMGNFPLVIRATDAAGHTAYLQVTSLVNDLHGATTGASKPVSSSLMIAWPFWLLLILILLVKPSGIFGRNVAEKV